MRANKKQWKVPATILSVERGTVTIKLASDYAEIAKNGAELHIATDSVKKITNALFTKLIS